MRAAEKPRAEHGIGATGDEALEESRPIRRVVLEIRVLHNDDVAVARRDGRAHRRAFPKVALLKDGLMNFSVREKPLEDVARPVAGAVIDADYLHGVWRPPNSLHNFADRICFIVYRY